MTPELINKITNILSIIILLGGVLVDSINAVPEGSSVLVYIGSAVAAIILFFMGKGALSLKKKNNLQ